MFGRSARKSVSQVSTQAYVAVGEAPAATMKEPCQARSLILAGRSLSTL
jgi:hypothetical protein